MTTYWQKIKNIVGPAYKKDFYTVGQKNTRTAFERYIVNNSTQQTRLLDAGCNTGVEAYRLYEAGFKGSYTGVDSNHKAVKLAKKNLEGISGYQFSNQDLSKLIYKNGYFDITLCKDVIEHQQYYTQILEELTRVTKGIFILPMFIKPTLIFRDKINFHRDGYYLNKYNYFKLVKFFEHRGFTKPKVIHIDWQDIVFIFKRRKT